MNEAVMSVTDTVRFTVVAACVVLLVASAGCNRDDAPPATSSAGLKGQQTGTPSPLAARTLKPLERQEPKRTPTRADTEKGAEANEPAYDPVAIQTEAEPSGGGAPLTVNFSAEVEGGPPGLHYQWDFGDGSAPSRFLKTSHTYQAAGEYTATFSVTGPGVEESNEESIDVDDEAFDLDIDADPDIGIVPLTVQFSAVIDDDEPGPFYYAWDFGDGGRDASNPTSHTYRVAGTYTAALTVTNSQGQVARHDVEIQVDPPGENGTD